jgi:hypothetical protein
MNLQLGRHVLKRDSRKFVFYEFGWLPIKMKYKAKPNNKEVYASDGAAFPIEVVVHFNSELNISSVFFT